MRRTYLRRLLAIAILILTGHVQAPASDGIGSHQNHGKAEHLLLPTRFADTGIVNSRPLETTTWWGLSQVRSSDTCEKQGCAPMSRILSVSSTAQLYSALSDAQPGDTILLESGTYDPLHLGNADFGSADAQVTITSADPDAAAILTGMRLTNVSGLAFEGVTFDYTYKAGENPEWADPFTMTGCTDISFRETVFDGDLARDYSAATDGKPAGFGLKIRDCDGIEISDSVFKTFFKAVHATDSTDVIFRDNDVFDIRSDGLNFIASQGILVEDNHIHDFHGLDGWSDHRDMIQFWTEGTDTPSTDIVIRGNLFDIGEGSYTQTIFMLNEMVERHQTAGPEMFYRNVTIENNVIINAHYHGITVGASDGVVIRNNSVLRNPAGKAELPDGDSSTPYITVSGMSTNVTIQDNLSAGIKGHKDQADWRVDNNHTVQDRDPGKANHYDAVFLGGTAVRTPDALVLQPGSDLETSGAGAAQSRYSGTSEEVTALFVADAPEGTSIRFDGGWSTNEGGQLDEETATFFWDFGDGTTSTAKAPIHEYAHGGIYTVTLTVTDTTGATSTMASEVAVESPTLLTFERDSGHFVLHGAEGTKAVDLDGKTIPSPTETVMNSESLATPDDTVIGIGAAFDAIELPQWQIARFFGSEDFSLDLTLRSTGPTGGTGEVLRIHKVLELHVDAYGEVIAKLLPGSAGEVRLRSDGAGLTDGDWHDLSLHFDGREGVFHVMSDGKLLVSGETDLTAIPAAQYWGLAIGAPWGRAFEGEIAHLALHVDEDAFIDPNALPELEEGWLIHGGGLGNSLFAEEMQIGTKCYATLDRQDMADFFGSDAFSIDFELRSDGATGVWGEVMRVHQVIETWISDTGQVVAKLFPRQANEVRLVSASDTIYDGDWHDIGLRYDSDEGLFQLLVDGRVEAEGFADQAMPDMKYWGLTFGAPWNRGFEGDVRDVVVKAAHRADPVDAFEFLDTVVAEDDAIPADTPAPDAGATETELASPTFDMALSASEAFVLETGDGLLL